MKKVLLTLSLSIVASMGSFAQNEPYKNPKLTPEERAEDLLGRLTLKEKIGLMKNSSFAVERLGVAPYNWWSEALHGVARNGLATVFPITMGMASTFDDEAIERVYVAVSDEGRAKFHDAHRRNRYGYGNEGLTFWNPNVNIFRDPRWGRGQETFGEDPYLTTRMGVAVVKGMQGPADAEYDKAHACVKHYAVHSGPEAKRHSFDVEDLSPRDLWETYLPAFKALVQEADVKEVMCAYQRLEGEPCCGSNRLLTQILRDEWGYKHLVVSDCGAIDDFFVKGRHETHKDAADASASAVINGTDLECGSIYSHLEEAVKQGLITEERIDTSLHRLLKARFALGEMDPDSIVPWSRISIDTVDCDLHKQMALDLARKSMVLLCNNGVLPLAKTGARIAVMGPNAVDSVMQWGNYEGVPSHTYTILEGIRCKIGDVPFEKGCELLDNRIFESYWNNMNLSGDVAATSQITSPINLSNGGNTAFATGVGLYNFTAVYEGSFRPKESGAYELLIEGDDGYRVYVNGEKVIDYWGEHASAKRDYTLKATAGTDYKIRIEYMQAGAEALLRFDLGIYRHISPEMVVDRVKEADIVIFAGGISLSLEGEEMYSVNSPGFAGGDRTSIELPQVQRDILKALKKAGKKVVFVNCSGSAVALVPEMESCDAILQAWYPGQSGGLAVADVLFGDFNPSGKLPVTFYKNTDQLPDFEDYSMKNRTYRYMTEVPLFPFGYGLSYTTFDISKGRLNKKTISAGQDLNFKVNVKNTGKYDGAEVIQVYVRKVDDAEGPIKSLRAFRRVPLKAGETCVVSIDLLPTTFEFFDPTTNTMRIMPGKYEIMYGNSSDIPSGNKLSVTLR
ncbi:MAG: xylan 1,4-beta-xylosidase [Bacteroides thetaiotaomicron]